jgi:hypothetical protein
MRPTHRTRVNSYSQWDYRDCDIASHRLPVTWAIAKVVETFSGHNPYTKTKAYRRLKRVPEGQRRAAIG